jgi:adenylate cyclase
VTAVAHRGAVFVAESTREAVGTAGDLEWSSIGARRLKGVSGDVKLFRVRRSAH